MDRNTDKEPTYRVTLIAVYALENLWQRSSLLENETVYPNQYDRYIIIVLAGGIKIVKTSGISDIPI